MPLLLTEDDVRQLLTMPMAIEAVEQAFFGMNQGTFLVHSRRRFRTPNKGVLHYMAAADLAGGYEGLKIYSVAKGMVRFLILLYRWETGELVAMIEAGLLGQIRTGAASGVGTKYMARPGARNVGVVGTGSQAPAQIEAVCAVRPVERVRVFGRNQERRNEFARAMSERLRVPVEPAGSAEEAVREADIVITITTAAHPVVESAWLAPGAHVNAAGSNQALKAEIDVETVRRAGVIATDSIEQAKMEAGDLIQAFGGDAGAWSRVLDLSHIVGGSMPGRHDQSEITLFKSNGIAIEDVAVAARVYELARGKGMGRQVPMFEKVEAH
ncbi:MAG TPA: ornithine cyclodeaminase family protein [Patescibacteria group bacterium]|nr:ornithine cyclodeaminase family protein [Patescibacteria group bacterium]